MTEFIMESMNNNDASRLENMAEEVTHSGLKSRFVYHHHRPDLAADIKPRSASCFDWQSGPVGGLEYGIMYSVSSLVHVRQSAAARLELSDHPHLRGHEAGAKRFVVMKMYIISGKSNANLISFSHLSALTSQRVYFVLFCHPFLRRSTLRRAYFLGRLSFGD